MPVTVEKRRGPHRDPLRNGLPHGYRPLEGHTGKLRCGNVNDHIRVIHRVGVGSWSVLLLFVVCVFSVVFWVTVGVIVTVEVFVRAGVFR